MQAQGGCQMCLSAVKLDHSGELFWDTPSWLSALVSVFLARRMDLNKGVPTLFAYCEKLIRKFFFKFNQGMCPWMAFAWNFFRDLKKFFLMGSVGQIIHREYIVFRGSNISCSLAYQPCDNPLGLTGLKAPTNQKGKKKAFDWTRHLYDRCQPCSWHHTYS